MNGVPMDLKLQMSEFSQMDEFELALNHKEMHLLLPVRLLNYGTAYKLEVEIDGTKVLFEPDEERNWRALISNEDAQANKRLDTALLELIAKQLDATLK
jgi:hypothetical protein